RSLAPREIIELERNGKGCAAWTRVQVAEDFESSRVRSSTLLGDVVLGRFGGQILVVEGLKMPSGVYNSTISDSVIGDNALVYEVKLLHNYSIAHAALAFNCGHVSCAGSTAFGN